MKSIIASGLASFLSLLGAESFAHKVNPKNNTQCTMTCGNGATRLGSCSNGWTEAGCNSAGDYFCKDKGGLAAGFPKLSGGGKGGVVYERVKGNLFAPAKTKSLSGFAAKPAATATPAASAPTTTTR